MVFSGNEAAVVVEQSSTESGGGSASRDPLEGFSMEITAKDVASLREASPLIPSGTGVSVTFLPGEDMSARVAAASTAGKLGFRPVPHVSARRLKSEAELDDFLSRLKASASIDSVFVVAGDLPRPEGPYEDALAIINSGLLEKHDIARVGIAGYPEGHPVISEEKLWRALKEKQRTLTRLGHGCEITTQFGFDADPVLAWLERLRQEGVEARVRVGIPGPANLKTLLRFAARCGVGASAKVMSKYGVSISRLLGRATPDTFIGRFAAGFDPAVHGEVALHFYPFGGVRATAQWVGEFAARRAMEKV